MKAITVCQPWAWAIAFGGKDIENRDWPTRYRGPLAIHAGKSCKCMWEAKWIEPLPPSKADLTFGAIVAVADLVDCVTESDSPWFVGDYGFVLANVVPLPAPIPARGALGLWTPDADTSRRLSLAIAQFPGRCVVCGRPGVFRDQSGRWRCCHACMLRNPGTNPPQRKPEPEEENR